MEQAFKKHKVISQRSIMDRIESFSKSTAQDESGLPPVLTGKDDLLKKQSTTSLDSMDMVNYISLFSKK